VEREFNEEYLTDGDVVQLDSHLLHYPFNRGIDYWYERHNRYSTMEAPAKLGAVKEPVEWTRLFGRDPTTRRRNLKRLAYRLPLRPTFVFLYLYVFRLGFLDGRAGFAFSRMRASYELMIDLKVFALERRQHNLPV
jgi:hypothetical protein